jgi:hypothetical protein
MIGAAYHTEARRRAEAVARETGWSLPDGWGVGPVGVHRDSDCLARSNWAAAIERLTVDVGPETPYDEDPGYDRDDPGTWEVVRFGHWAVGWVDEIAYRIAGPAAHLILDMAEALEDYPVLDEMALSELEYSECLEYLESEVPAGIDAHDVWRWLFDGGYDTAPDSLRWEAVSEAFDAVTEQMLDAAERAANERIDAMMAPYRLPF